MKKTIKILLLGVIVATLSACSGFFDKDNTPNPSPLVNFSPEARIATRYYTKTTNGVGKDYLKLAPAVTYDTVFTADKNGKVTASDKATGKTKWQTNVKNNVSAGTAADENIVVVATHDGDVIALNAANGTPHFQTKASSEILANPVIANDVVLIKAIDGKLSAYSSHDGHLLWAYEQTEPSLILRGASTPAIADHITVAGFANGNLAKLTIQGGSLQWQNTIAHPAGSFAI
ncbi:MAG TPA: PQQ-binding-like beta-propeller repeat protein, partial [Gammaproteobacteria bacterium]|nr:PQQ-binding-like beta-propeller repeat protein [Gammaproteobacteria bacterium]